MNMAAKFCLLLAAVGLAGMAAPPDRTKDAEYKEGRGENEDAALIAELDQWEELAVAENYEFFQALEILQDAPPGKPPGTQEEAK